MDEGLTDRDEFLRRTKAIAHQDEFLRRTESLALSARAINELPMVASPPAHHDGVMVALVPDSPEELALGHPEALPADDLHITLCYLGKMQDLSNDDMIRILDEARRVCDAHGYEFTATPDGVVVMGQNDEGVPATALLVQSDEVVTLYDAMTEALDYHSNFPSFIPHMTVGYGVPVELAQENVGKTVDFRNVLVKFGDDKHLIPLRSAITAARGTGGANTIDRVIDSRGRLWDEGLHPRGSDGVFVEKDGAVSGKVTVTKPDGSSAEVVAQRVPVTGFKTIDNEVWVLVEILNEDGTTSQGMAKSTNVKSVAQVKARLDDPDYADRVEAIREDISVTDPVSTAEVP